MEAECRRAIDTGEPTLFEEHYPSLGGWHEVHVWPDRDGLNVSFSNVEERHVADRERDEALSAAQQTTARLQGLLTELSSRLGGLSTQAEVFEELTRCVIPEMADWCTLVAPQRDELVRIAAVHRIPDLDALVKRLVGAYPHPFSGPSPGVVAWRTGEPLRLERLAQEIIADLDDSAASAAYGRTLQLLGDGLALIMPLPFHGEVAAVLTLIRSGGAPYDDDDLETMGEVALRVATALDDARHVERQRETASALQAAALPETLPRSPRSSSRPATGRFASEGSQVGGDWYDAFELETGRIVLVVGDAAGHGLQAAAMMARMRNALRAHLFDAFGPSESLMRLSRLIATEHQDAFATIICVELDSSKRPGNVGVGQPSGADCGQQGGDVRAPARGADVFLIGWLDGGRREPAQAPRARARAR